MLRFAKELRWYSKEARSVSVETICQMSFKECRDYISTHIGEYKKQVNMGSMRSFYRGWVMDDPSNCFSAPGADYGMSCYDYGINHWGGS